MRRDDEVLSMIAQAGEGSVRDSLSALDQAIACCGNTLGVTEIRSLLGMFGADSLRAVAEAIERSDGGAMLEIVQELERTGQSLQHFCRELSRYWRNLLVARIAGKHTRLIPASEPEQNVLRETADRFSEEDLTRYLNLTLNLYKDLQYSLAPRLHLELGLVRLVQAGRLQSIEAAIAGLGVIDMPVNSSPVAAGSSLTATAKKSAPRPPTFQSPIRVGALPVEKTAPAVASSEETAVAENPTVLDRPVQTQAPAALEATSAIAPEDPLPDLRQALHDALCKAGMQYSADAVQHSEVTLSGNDLLIRAPRNMVFSLKDPGVQRLAAQVMGKAVRLKVEAGENLQLATSPAETKDSGDDNGVRERALSHPGVKRFQELFPGAHVRTVRNLNE